MGHAQVKTVTSTDFLRNVSAAKRIAHAGGTVIITDRGEPSIAMIPIAEYRRLTQTGKKNLLQLLHMPEADAYDFDPEPVRIKARNIN